MTLRAVNRVIELIDGPVETFPHLFIRSYPLQFGISLAYMQQCIHGLVGDHIILRQLVIHIWNEIYGIRLTVTITQTTFGLDHMEQIHGEIQCFPMAGRIIIRS